MQRKSIIMSISPKIAYSLFSGKAKYHVVYYINKKYINSIVTVYATSPVSRIIGTFEIKDILPKPKTLVLTTYLWKTNLSFDFLSEKLRFADNACLIEVSEPKLFIKQFHLKEYSISKPPQFFQEL